MNVGIWSRTILGDNVWLITAKEVTKIAIIILRVYTVIPNFHFESLGIWEDKWHEEKKKLKQMVSENGHCQGTAVVEFTNSQEQRLPCRSAQITWPDQVLGVRSRNSTCSQTIQYYSLEYSYSGSVGTHVLLSCV